MGPAAGEPALRDAIAAKLSTENGIATTAQQVLVTNGGKQALYNLFQVLLEPGDELLLPAPYWLSYPEIAKLAGASVTMLPSSAAQGFRLDPAQLEAAITPASKLLVLNSPGNPHRHGAEPAGAGGDCRRAAPPSPGGRGVR
jgi:L-aspartate aminotransferase apoenzyme (EC 2.6.1.1)